MRGYRICLLETHSVCAQENGGSTELVGGGTISQQKQPPKHPANLAPCTMLLGEVEEPDSDTLNIDSTPSTESTAAYGQMNDGTVLDAVASPTTTQEASSVVGMSSPSVVVPILGEIVVDPTSTFSMTTGTAWATPSVSLAVNDTSRYEDTPPGRPPNPMTTTRAETQCSQKKVKASKFWRQAPNDPSCGPDGSPSSGTPSQEPPPGGPTYMPSESPCSSSSATGTNASPAASTSSSVPSTMFPPLPPLLQWFQCVVVTIFAVSGCIYLVRRKLKNAQPKLECSESYPSQADVPGAFYGSGRRCGSRGSESWIAEWLRKKTGSYFACFVAKSHRDKRFLPAPAPG